MAYQFDFGAVLAYTPVLIKGVAVTVELTVFGAVFGLLMGVAGAWARTHGPALVGRPVTAYVELVRNTPFLIQLFFIFFGLPSLGIHMGEMNAACLAMALNLGAYCTEIIRAGIAATPRGQFEAAASLAMSRVQTFMHIVIKPALRRVWPALVSQIVIVMLGSAVCSQIAAPDLSYAANFIQSRNFRAFESYLVATGLYLALSLLTRQILLLLGHWYFGRRSA
ncbi:amino acid ABC transporter permease [Bordetella sp. FB-8]|uniref:amino acid ABC transporter permease n=1 Tax=Bordetella sp. FB-8 TaxID=1159870 RepID=UPI0003A243A0|nr:amino acid ABC transporter permease [Bordetella sp. FB-8]